jgi:hypothetical protein
MSNVEIRSSSLNRAHFRHRFYPVPGLCEFCSALQVDLLDAMLEAGL